MNLIAARKKNAGRPLDNLQSLLVMHVLASRYVNRVDSFDAQLFEDLLVFSTHPFRLIRSHGHDDDAGFSPARKPDEFLENGAVALPVFPAADDDQLAL